MNPRFDKELELDGSMLEVCGPVAFDGTADVGKTFVLTHVEITDRLHHTVSTDVDVRVLFAAGAEWMVEIDAGNLVLGSPAHGSARGHEIAPDGSAGAQHVWDDMSRPPRPPIGPLEIVATGTSARSRRSSTATPA
jgi:hypothetical protein